MNNKETSDRSALAKSETHQQPPPTRAKSWASPSSKFNRIFSNLERSILSQFNGNTNNNANATTATTTTNSQCGNRLKFSASAANLPSQAQSKSSTNSSPNNKFKVQNDSLQTASTSDRRIALHQQKQMKSEPTTTKVKTTLNKYQQQIVSTMRQNQHHLLLNAAGSHNINNTNKLSIPPPHANDEARNQSHRLLFGAPPASASQEQSDSVNRTSLVVGSSATLRPSKRHTTTRVGDIIRLDDALASGDSTTRASSSPASSAKSLPTTIIASSNKSSGSQECNSNSNSNSSNKESKTNKEDEESGFSTYQSNRSLIANSHSITSTGDKSSKQQSSSNHSNMIIMQTQTQVSPLISGPCINFNNGNATLVPQKMMYGYYPTQVSQQSMNTQQHQLVGASNQVPIMSTLDQTVATNNCYTNNQSNLLQQQQQINHHHHNHQPMRLSQNNHFNDLQHHQNQQPPFGSLYSGSMTVPMQSTQHHQPVASNLDANVTGGQEIYANAPPKPRRYQYYDTTATFGQPRFAHHQLMLAPQMLPAKPATMITTTTTAALPTGNNANSFYQHQQYNRQNYPQQPQMPNQQPIYNISYLQVPNNLYQQQLQQHQPSARANNGALLMNNNQYNGFQHRPAPPLPPGQAGWLTKSKSSLETCDLMRYKLNKSSPIDTQQQAHSNASHCVPQLYNQQQHQQIYGSRFDNSNSQQQQHYPVSNHHQQSHFAQSNLQRSKSVTQLVPDYEHQRATNQQAQQQRDLLLADSRRTINGAKFLSSASTTNLNVAGLYNEQNQFANFSSQTQQLQQPQYHDLVNQQGNQILAATLQRQQRMTNCWHNQASPNGINLQQQQQQQQSQHQKTNINTSTSISFNTATNSSPTVFGNKISRQSQSDKSTNNNSNLNEDGSKKPSLDDKIRFLVTGRDTGSDSRDEASLLVRNQDNITAANGNSQSVIYNQQADISNSAQVWARQQASSNPPPSSDTATGSAADLGLRTRDIHSTQVDTNTNLSSCKSSSHHLEESNDGLFYMNDYTMGNRSQRQYHVQNEQHNNKADLSPVRGQHQAPTNEVSRYHKSAGGTNSQLIVDLTTPRVLAKTQTTLLATGSQLDLRQNKDSCSINQVGLPQLYSNQQQQQQQQQQQSQRLVKAVNSGNSDTKLKEQQIPVDISASSDTNPASKVDICERTAPYYYSDLKSEEQRRALLSIVQQKSLSPPPQLLSRGIDQSGTRLALKSATLHPGQARMLSENLAQRQRVACGSNTRSLPSASAGESDSLFSSSTANIATENMNKLFTDRQMQPGKHAKVVQSMLALNDCHKANLIDSDNQRRLSTCNVQSASCSKSVGGDGGYFDGELRSSKSKSLENLSQRSSKEGLDVSSIGNVRQTINKFGVPVYENICRTDKLMSAINNSTTCLSSSKSRANRRPQMDGLGNALQANQQQFQGKCKSVSDESMDSILGSSLDESDSSLDIIDEIKLSPTDNHLSDICKLIEQLKLNHAKLSEEYKSTLVRISKTINSSSKQVVGSDSKNDKLARRLQLLEMKSKKCETRSKNQLALIQMMETVLKQSKLRSSSTSKRQSSKQPTSASSSRDSSMDLAGGKPVANGKDQLTGGSPYLSFDFQNAKQPMTKEPPVKPAAGPAIPERTGLIRAFVTESELQPEVKQASGVGDANKQISLSTRHHRQSGFMQQQQQSESSAIGPSDKLKDKSRQQQRRDEADASIVSTNMDSGSGSSANGKSGSAPNSKESDAEDEAESSSSSSSGSSVSLASGRMKVVGSKRTSPVANGSQLLLNDDNLMREDDDFIEFISADTSGHRSQFEASQFSASDFNTSTSNSESSSSGANNDSLNSPLIGNPGDLKALISANNKSRSMFNCNGQTDDRSHNNNNDNDESDNLKGTTNQGNTTTGGYIDNDGGKFKNVLGNVIDVDVCPMNNLTPSSPVNNQVR